jgi:uroporphyrinogen III methyltransferase/synthase
MRGKVFLVGAGPGDPGLITVKGLKCLKQAEVIIYDRLIDERLLQEARSDAELIYVGKSAQHHALEQSQINELLIVKAQQNKIVVRLKGGDPFVLGRGGEEAEALASHKIPFEIVPGISSAIAVPAYAGIPVTHRGLSSSFAVFTGHEDPSKEDTSLAWDKLATGTDTLVFLMGVANLAQTASELIKNGRPPDTPAALIRQGTTPQQQTLVGTLENIAALAEQKKFKPPAVLLVGEVVKLRQHLAWFDNRPLFGHRILVTRSRHQASALSQLLTERGALPV